MLSLSKHHSATDVPPPSGKLRVSGFVVGGRSAADHSIPLKHNPLLRPFIHMKAEHIGPRIMPHHIEIIARAG